MAATITVRTEGFEQVFAVLDRLERPQWDRLLWLIGKTVEEQTITHFALQGGPEGPWAERTREYPWPILLRPPTTLRDSIEAEPLPPDAVKIGTSVWYGVFHQKGTSKMVRRMFLGLTESDKQELTDVIENYLSNLVKP